MKAVLVIGLAALVALSGQAPAASVVAGKAKSMLCAGCHGQNGIAQNRNWPNLAGQNEDYLIAQIKAFKNGTRSNPLMAPVVRTLSDRDIRDLAAYYESLSCK
jgi:cytochrome c553